MLTMVLILAAGVLVMVALGLLGMLVLGLAILISTKVQAGLGRFRQPPALEGLKSLTLRRQTPRRSWFPRLGIGLAAFLAFGGAWLHAQSGSISNPVITGVLDYVSPQTGTLRIRAEQVAYRPLVFSNMNSVNFVSEGGLIATLADLAPGMEVTLFFARWGRIWIVSKVLIHDPFPIFIPSPEDWIPNDHYRLSPSDVDGDPTTRGPDSAAFDNDPTTVPARGARGYFRRRAP